MVGEPPIGILRQYGVVRVCCAVGEPAFAERLIGQPFDHYPRFIGDRGDAAEVVAVHIPGGPGGAVDEFDHRNHLAVGGDVVALFGAVVRFDVFFVQQVAVVAGVEVVGGALAAGDLFDALVFGALVEGEAQARAAHGDGHVEAGVVLRPALVGDDVVGGVVLGFGGEAAVCVVLVDAFAARAEGELGQCMGADAADAAGVVDIAVGGRQVAAADDVADGVEGEGGGDDARTIGVDGGAGEAVETVVEEGFAQALVSVADRAVLGGAITGQRGGLDQVGACGATDGEAVGAAIVDACAIEVVPFGPGAVGAGLAGFAAEVVVGPGGGESVKP